MSPTTPVRAARAGVVSCPAVAMAAADRVGYDGPRMSWRRATLATALAGCLAGCTPPAQAPPPVPLRIATGGPGGAYYPLGQALSRLYAERVPGVAPAVDTGTSGQNVRAVEGGGVQVAFTQADVAYTAYRRGADDAPRPFTRLRGIAVLWVNTVHVAVPTASPLRTVADLRGRRVAVGTRGSGTEALARIVLETYGLSYGDVRPDFASFVRTVEAMRAGEADAGFVVAGLPADAMMDLSRAPGVRMLPVDRQHVQAMRGQYPFLEPMVVPAGTYPGQSADVATVGVSNLLVCRDDLDESLVYQLTRTLFEALPQLARTHPAAGLIDPEQAPATPIPLHPGAARYYREREITQ
jgi:TRAP transporter TAXI family solute receptor